MPFGPLAVAKESKPATTSSRSTATPLAARDESRSAALVQDGPPRRCSPSHRTPDGPHRDVAVRPIGDGGGKEPAVSRVGRERRAYVAKISGGRLGYVHMFDMGAGSLAQLYVDLDAENHARDGVVIDVRNNNGGFVNRVRDRCVRAARLPHDAGGAANRRRRRARRSASARSKSRRFS